MMHSQSFVAQSFRAGRIAFGGCNFDNTIKHTEFQAKVKQAAVEEVAKTQVIATFCLLNVTSLG